MTAQNEIPPNESSAMDIPPTAASGRTSTTTEFEKEHIQPPAASYHVASDGESEAEAHNGTSVTAAEEKVSERLSNTMSRAVTNTASIQRVQTREDGSEYPTGLPLFLIILALCLAVFVMSLDNTIIATAIPKITDEFDSLDDLGWYASGKSILPLSSSLISFHRDFFHSRMYSMLNGR